ncbi:MAG: peptidoglycan-binding protein [Rhizobiales bacterium]|nr:peptidoglycan-binding protein [Hyphomicrobiales bacterium]
MKNRSDNIIFSILQEHPSVAAGMVTFAVAFSLVAGNAIYAQSGSHPLPLWATRDHVTTQSIQVTSNFKADAFKPVVRPVKTTMHRLDNSTVRQNKMATSVINNGSDLVADVQRALLKAGVYKGGVDGQRGPMTRAAISAYQSKNSLQVDGFASSALLNHIGGNVQKAKVIVAPKPSPVATSQSTVKYNEKIVKIVQQGLYNFGEPDISVDGIYGSQTAAAIMRFQEKFNLTKTGIPDLALIESLISKNALPAG